MTKYLLILCLLSSVSWAGDAYFIDGTNGSDNNAGTSWATAFRTCGHADTATAVGDTVVFKPNDTLYDCHFKFPAGGSPTVVTLWCDSTFYATLGDGNHYSPHGPGVKAPVLYAGHDVTQDAAVQSNAWMQHSGNVYKARWTEVFSSDYSGGVSYVAAAVQNHDSMLMSLQSLAHVNGEGEYYYDDANDTVYAWKYGGGDPDGTSMIFSRAAVFDHDQDGPCDYAKITGLDVRCGSPGTIFLKDKEMPNHLTVQHCYVTRAGYNGSPVQGENPGCFKSDNWNSGVGKGQYNTIRACSLGWVMNGGDAGTTAPRDAFTHGGSVVIYAQDHFTVDSCYFFGFSLIAVDFKCDNTPTREFIGNVVKYSTFMPTPGSPRWGGSHGASRFATRQVDDSIYGNIYANVGTCVVFQAYSTHVGPNYNEDCVVLNNTAYNVGSFFFARKQPEDSCRGGNKVMYNIVENYVPAWSFESKSDVSGFYNLGYSNSAFVDTVCQKQFGIIDSNAYHDSTDTFTFWDGYWGYNKTFSQWQGLPPYPDSHSIIASSSLLASPANGDYSPTSEVPSMNLTYGGQTWTRWGAVQDTTPIAPTASFTGSPLVGTAPLQVNFTDRSTGTISSWNWTFGDGDTSTQRNPPHVYSAEGSYTVGLTVTGSAGTDTYSITDYVQVVSPGTDVTPPATSSPQVLQLPQTNVSLARDVTPQVCGYYSSAYSADRMTDGIVNPYGYESTTWSSDADSTVEHWVEIDFLISRTIDSVVLYWAWSTLRSAWMTPERFYVQSWDGAQFVTEVDVNAAPADSLTRTFTPWMNSSRIRIYQPPLGGPPPYREVLWLTEVEVYGR